MRPRPDAALPCAAGIGLRAPHVAQVLDARPAVAWFEVHSENYFADGGPAIAALERVRARYPLALHGVGLALGSCAPLDRGHLAKLKRLVARVDPALVSEHLCWGRTAARHFNELLPLPCTDEALALACERVGAVQEALGRSILVENIASYFRFAESAIPEHEFLSALARRSGCGLLLDVNNAYVNARNHGGDAAAFIDGIASDAVREIHLAGFDASGPLVIDTHGAAVAPAVWALYERALERFGPVATLVEWDTDIPAFAVLEREAATAQRLMEGCRAHAA